MQHLKRTTEKNKRRSVTASIEILPCVSGMHGGAIINDAGEEIPITEKMILDACDKLARDWWYPSKRKS